MAMECMNGKGPTHRTPDGWRLVLFTDWETMLFKWRMGEMEDEWKWERSCLDTW